MPFELLQRALNLYNATLEEFLNIICDMISVNYKNHFPNKDKQLVVDKNEDIYGYLYQEIKTEWIKNTNISVEILDQWIYDSSILFIYVIIIRQRFLTGEIFAFSKEHGLNTIDVWFIIYYAMPLTDLTAVDNIPIWILKSEQEVKKKKKEKELINHYIKLIQ